MNVTDQFNDIDIEQILVFKCLRLSTITHISIRNLMQKMPEEFKLVQCNRLFSMLLTHKYTV